ncbi:MAG: FmdB family zinc ribbon protein [Vicinamibacterales bacterium]
MRYHGHMPLYEYECRSCHHHFELLVREHTVLACPSCESQELDKQLSVFAVGAPSTQFAPRPASPGPCGSCGDPRGPGSCSMN